MTIRIALATLTFVAAAGAQNSPAFEAASIHRNLSGGMNTRIDISGGRVTITNASLQTLIRNAWDLLGFQFAGGPGWLDGEMYDIAATTGSSAKIGNGEFRLLLRSLLEDRFQLKTHFEEREAPVYVLIIGKDGHRLKPGSAGTEPSINTRKGAAEAHMKGSNAPISILASNLGNQLGRMVQDETGLTGGWDWQLDWDPSSSADSNEPSLVTAIRQQLGLKLQPRKGLMKVLVIDSVHKPSDN
jgi:uncharacterized protein (TIGR03435 family)